MKSDRFIKKIGQPYSWKERFWWGRWIVMIKTTTRGLTMWACSRLDICFSSTANSVSLPHQGTIYLLEHQPPPLGVRALDEITSKDFCNCNMFFLTLPATPTKQLLRSKRGFPWILLLFNILMPKMWMALLGFWGALLGTLTSSEQWKDSV